MAHYLAVVSNVEHHARPHHFGHQMYIGIYKRRILEEGDIEIVFDAAFF